PADAPVITTTSGARLTKGLLLFYSDVRAVERVRGGYAYQNPGEEPRHTRRKKQTETESCSAPGGHAIGTGNQMTDAALKSTARVAPLPLRPRPNCECNSQTAREGCR